VNFFEREIAKYERRIKRIEHSSDQTKLKSNKLYYELERDHRVAQLEAWKSGRPFATCGSRLSPLLRALGFEYIDTIQAADRLGDDADRYFEIVRSQEFPDTVCDRTLLCVPMHTSGDVPKPSLLISSNIACDNIRHALHAIGAYFDIPVFPISVSIHNNQTTLEYARQQLEELIDFAETMVPGTEYSEERLLEYQELDRTGFTLYHDIYELRKRTPCPLSPRDAFREERIPSLYSNPRQANGWLEAMRDELYERHQKGNGREENLRIMWTVSGPLLFDPFHVLEEKGISLLFLQHGGTSRFSGGRFGVGVYGDTKEYGRKLSPLEEQARMMIGTNWIGLADRWIDDCLWLCEDSRVDAIVNYMQSGCVQTLGLGRLLEEAAMERLNIPVLHVEGRGLEAASFDQQHFDELLTVFFDRCIASKHIHG